MIIKGLIDEDFVNYYLPSMFIASAFCDWKCCHDLNIDNNMCQNSSLYSAKNFNISTDEIFRRYISNPLTHSIVFGGLEPMLQFDDLLEIIKYFRDHDVDDNIIVYTGYNPEEIEDRINALRRFKNIILKFGRFIPNQKKHFDPILKVWLASDNQFAKKIS